MKTKLNIEDIPYKDKTGWVDVIEEYNSATIRSLYPLLGNSLYHRCSIESMISILNDGFLKPNKGIFNPTHEKSKQNYGYKNGWICLFDFSESPFHVAIPINSWKKFFCDFTPTIILEIDRNNLPKIIPPKYHRDLDEKERKFCIAFVEAWYPEPLDISLFAKYIIVEPNSDPVNYFVITRNDILKYIQKHPKYSPALAFSKLYSGYKIPRKESNLD